jgi:hypothetical protein
MNKRVALVSAVVAVALVAAVFGATMALQLIGSGTFGPGGSKPLSEADVQRSLAAAPTTPPGGTATQPASPQPSDTAGSGQVTRTGRRSFGGNAVFASCTGSQARITSWIPAGGFSADESSTGPAQSAFVKFKSASSEITVTVTCPGGEPQFTRSLDERGGGHGGGGSGRGRGGGGN